MKTVINLGDKFKDEIRTLYPALEGPDVPSDIVTEPMDYKKEEINTYHVLFWHRLMRRIYGEPTEIEYDLWVPNGQESFASDTIVIKKTGEPGKGEVSGISEELALKLSTGQVKPRIPINWKYYVALPSGGIMTLYTKDRNTAFYIGYILGTGDITENADEERKAFIQKLLQEANRMKDQLFNPMKEFERDSRLKLYMLTNVYLANYVSGKRMLDVAESEESDLAHEWLGYDAGAYEYLEQEKKRTFDELQLARGMFYFSAISYFFMSLEGFVNIVFHAFLRKDLRDRDLNLDQRLDLELKLRLMTSLCHCFPENAGLSPEIYDRFKKLKKYRNSLFHAKIEDSLKTLCFLENGFFYNYIIDFDDHKGRFLPDDKGRLVVSDVLEAKAVVDEIVNGILNCMKKDSRILAERYVLNGSAIPFFLSESGDLSMTMEQKTTDT